MRARTRTTRAQKKKTGEETGNWNEREPEVYQTKEEEKKEKKKQRTKGMRGNSATVLQVEQGSYA